MLPAVMLENRPPLTATPQAVCSLLSETEAAPTAKGNSRFVTLRLSYVISDYTHDRWHDHADLPGFVSALTQGGRSTNPCRSAPVDLTPIHVPSQKATVSSESGGIAAPTADRRFSSSNTRRSSYFPGRSMPGGNARPSWQPTPQGAKVKLDAHAKCCV